LFVNSTCERFFTIQLITLYPLISYKLYVTVPAALSRNINWNWI
jgi:hypothetical protein